MARVLFRILHRPSSTSSSRLLTRYEISFLLWDEFGREKEKKEFG